MHTYHCWIKYLYLILLTAPSDYLVRCSNLSSIQANIENNQHTQRSLTRTIKRIRRTEIEQNRKQDSPLINDYKVWLYDYHLVKIYQGEHFRMTCTLPVIYYLLQNVVHFFQYVIKVNITSLSIKLCYYLHSIYRFSFFSFFFIIKHQ